jgi:hypothetical protein
MRSDSCSAVGQGHVLFCCRFCVADVLPNWLKWWLGIVSAVLRWFERIFATLNITGFALSSMQV